MFLSGMALAFAKSLASLVSRVVIFLHDWQATRTALKKIYKKNTERNPFSQGKGHSEMGTKTDGSLSTSFKRYKYILSLFSQVQIMYY